MFQDMVRQAHQNTVPFRYVLADSWYTNSENIDLVPGSKHHYLGAVKSNLEIALSKQDRANRYAGAGKLVNCFYCPLM